MTPQDPTVPEKAPKADPIDLPEPRDFPRPEADPAPDAMPDPLADPDLDNPPDPAPLPQGAAKRKRGGGVVAPLLGGALALGIGFAAAQFDLLGLRPAPDDAALTALAARADKLQADLAAAEAAQSQALAAAAARIDALEAAPAAEAPGEDPALRADIAALSDRLAKLEAALANLSAAPADGSVGAGQLAALAATVEDLRGQIAAATAAPDAAAIRALVDEELKARELAQSEKLKAETAAAAAQAARSAALGKLSLAAQTGAPYADLLPALGADLPAIVTRYAASGLPPLAQDFPEAARRALEVARRADPGSSMGDRFLSFLKTQTGARSLTPQEGDDPDAVLSRAEAAVTRGEAQAALDEIATLPPEAQAELADWAALARDHLAFAQALAALTAAEPKP